MEQEIITETGGLGEPPGPSVRLPGGGIRGTFYVMVVGVLALVPVALPLASVLSADDPHALSFLSVYICDITLSSLALLACVLIFFFVVTCRTQFMFKVESRDSEAAFIIPLVVLGIVTSAITFYHASRSATCLRSTVSSSFYATKFASQIFNGIIVAMETITIALLRKYRCNHSVARFLIGLAGAQTVGMLVNVVLDVFRADNTRSRSDGDLGNSTGAYVFFQHDPVFSYCNNTTELIDKEAVDVYDVVYPANFIYCVFCLCFLYLMCNFHVHQTPPTEDEDISDHRTDSSSLVRSKRMPVSRIQQILDNCFFKPLLLLSRYSWGVSSVFTVLYMTFKIVTDVLSRQSDASNHGNDTVTNLETVGYYVQTVEYYIFISVMFFGYLLIPKSIEIYREREFWDKVLFWLVFGYILFNILETIDSVITLCYYHEKRLTEKVLYFIRIVLKYVGMYCQTFFILYVFEFVKTVGANDEKHCIRYVYLKGVVIFLFLTNMMHFTVDVTLTSPTTAYIADIAGEDTFGATNWATLTRLLYPAVAGYRLLSTGMLFRVLRRSKNWSDIDEALKQLDRKRGYVQLQ